MTALRAPVRPPAGLSDPATEAGAAPVAQPAPESREAPRVPSMDGFRALAILWVFLLHAWVNSGRAPVDHGLFRALVAEGYLGLDVLFVVSGFVLFLPAAMNQGSMGSIRSYALRRAARIVPAYYVSLAVALAFHRWIAPGVVVLRPWESWAGLQSLVSHLLFLHGYTQSAGAPLGFGVHLVIWTLTLEATFYVLLPFVARAFHRRPLLWLAGSLVAAELWQRAVVPAGFSASTLPSLGMLRLVGSVPTYAGHFALGMAGACLFVRLQGAAASRTGRLAAVSVQIASAAALIGFILHRSGASIGTKYYVVERMNTGFVAVLFGVCMLATTLAPRWAQWPFANRLLAGLGDASYGVYLSHVLLLSLAASMLGVRGDGSNDAFAQLVFFTLPPALALGWLSCRFLEQPARLWARRLLWRSRSAAPALGWHDTHGHDGQRGHGARQGLDGDHQHDENEARAG